MTSHKQEQSKSHNSSDKQNLLCTCFFPPAIKNKYIFSLSFLLIFDIAYATTINTGSSSVTQEIGNITPGSPNQPILKIIIVTTGGGTAASICSMQFTMNNTVNGDVSAAKLYYTGTTNAFATTTQLGSTVVNPTGTITFTFTQNHGSGTFYYWLAFDIVNCVPDCHYFDAFVPSNGVSYVNASTTCTGTSTFTPTTPDPTGSKNTYCEVSDTWNQRADFTSTPRRDAKGFVEGNILYMGTGTASGPTYFNDFWAWDQTTNLWTQKANFSGGARHSTIGFSLGTKGYLGTGRTGPSYQDMWEYDPVLNIWTQKSNFGAGERMGAVALSINGKGYAGTGANSIDPLLKDFWEYDPVSDTWTQKTDFGGVGRAFASAFTIGNKGYVTGGYTAVTTSYKTPINDIWEYDPATNAWIQKTNFPGSARAEACAFSISSKGYIGAGSVDAATRLKDFWEYDPNTNSWLQRADIPGEIRSAGIGFSVNTKGYAGLGFGASSYLSDFYEYIASGAGLSNSITISSISPTTLCRGGNVTINYTISGTFYSGNIFTTQLSDASGSFSTPTNIGNVSSTTNTPINATIPVEQTMGSSYRIRVISSCPSITGSDNGSNLIVPGNCTFYWVGGEGNWNDPVFWSTSTGGTGGAGAPNIHINVVIDDNSGTSATIPIHIPGPAAWYTRQFNMTGTNGKQTTIIGQGSLLPRPNAAD